MTTPAQETSRTFGQSLWYDNVQRSALSDGSFAQLLEDGVLGCTSNPSIFHKAISGSKDYDEAFSQLVSEGKSTQEIYYDLVITDIQGAADQLRKIYDATHCIDGYVSVEVLPKNSHNAEETVKEGLWLRERIDRPNVLIKVPATEAGYRAITELTAHGVSINATLIFSRAQYESVARAFLAGLSRAKENGHDLSRIASVASFFVSRIDAQVDGLLDKSGPQELKSKIAIANAKMAYQLFNELFSKENFGVLGKAGAQKQRLLWASTGTKNPAYSDTLYLDSLIGAETVNTVPPATLAAFQDHGTPQNSLTRDLEGAQADLDALEKAGHSLDAVCKTLLEEGLKSFSDSMDALMAVIEERRQALAAE
jgi:transaldolase